MGRPGKRHRRAARALGHELGAVDANVGGTGSWIEIEPEVRIGERLFDPDLAGFRVDRVPELPDDNPIAIVPDWCCEVISPGTGRTDLTIKLPLYIREGVAHVWIVDPTERVVQVFVPVNARPTLIATASDDDAVRLPPFDLDLHPARWWIDRTP
jgi:Uma2 family endonuclease